MRYKHDAISGEWSFYDRSYPLFDWAEISIKSDRNVPHPDKLYIVSHYGVDRYIGGTFDDGWVTGRIRDLGARYEIAYDDESPVLTAFGAAGDRLRIAAYDAKSGLRMLKGYVDGVFVLFERQDKSNMYVCRLSESPIRKNGLMRKLTVLALDNRNNKKIFTTHFRY